jgi:hypothetical protein
MKSKGNRIINRLPNSAIGWTCDHSAQDSHVAFQKPRSKAFWFEDFVGKEMKPQSFPSCDKEFWNFKSRSFHEAYAKHVPDREGCRPEARKLSSTQAAYVYRHYPIASIIIRFSLLRLTETVSTIVAIWCSRHRRNTNRNLGGPEVVDSCQGSGMLDKSQGRSEFLNCH